MKPCQKPTKQELEKQAYGNTKIRCTHSQEYDIYVSNARALGWPIKSFDDWLTS